MAGTTTAIDMATQEKSTPGVTNGSIPGSSKGTSSAQAQHEDFVPTPMFHTATHHSVDIEDYFRGPRDINRHSKWPHFLRLHGSVLPKMIVPLTVVGGWATAIVCISELVQWLGIESVLLTVLGEF